MSTRILVAKRAKPISEENSVMQDERLILDSAYRTSTRDQRRRGASARTASSRDHVSEIEIRERAYQIYQRREAWSGDALGDWLQAEKELAAEGQARCRETPEQWAKGDAVTMKSHA
jgi:hypothetical protein